MTDETMIIEIARTLGIRPQQVQAALSLLDEGNTIPFIARYRKEATGTLDEVQLRCIQEQYAYEQALASRKETVRQSIEDQGCWNAELGHFPQGKAGKSAGQPGRLPRQRYSSRPCP